MKPYPIKFEPILKERIWGGEKLTKHYNKNSSKKNIGESWEISGVKGDLSMVSTGYLKGLSIVDIIKKYKHLAVGAQNYDIYRDDFPILIKYLDAKTPLSIQVHPNDEIAKSQHQSFGKNEMWYVMDGEKDSELIVGFHQSVDLQKYNEALVNNDVLKLLNVEKTTKGDTYMIPAGRIHAIGAGNVIAEIQQTSDVTYRIFDYDRVDIATGEKRELHNDLAMKCIDYNAYDSYKTEYTLEKNKTSKLVHCPYFKTNIIEIENRFAKDYTQIDSFIIYMCVEGDAEISCEGEKTPIKKGETVLLPATTNKISIHATYAKLLEVSL